MVLVAPLLVRAATKTLRDASLLTGIAPLLTGEVTPAAGGASSARRFDLNEFGVDFRVSEVPHLARCLRFSGNQLCSEWFWKGGESRLAQAN